VEQEEWKEEDEETNERSNITGMVVKDKIIDILVLLERKKRAMEMRLAKIKARMTELYGKI
jgi:hypothetical protein